MKAHQSYNAPAGRTAFLLSRRRAVEGSWSVLAEDQTRLPDDHRPLAVQVGSTIELGLLRNLLIGQSSFVCISVRSYGRLR